jgi:uncharacterized membrane protein
MTQDNLENRIKSFRTFSVASFAGVGINVVVPVVCALAIQKFCYVGWLRSIIATVLYMAWMIVWPILFDKVTH